MPLIALLLFVVRRTTSGNEHLRGIQVRSLLIVSATGILGSGLVPTFSSTPSRKPIQLKSLR